MNRSMEGLVFIEPLRLTPIQWAAVGLNAVGWLWYFRWSQHWSTTALLTFGGLWIAFWGTTTCVDEWLLFRDARALQPLGWSALLDALPRQWYVNYQPPFLTFWFARQPSLWLHQLLWLPWAVLCAALMRQLYGRCAALLLATPVLALMIHQPSHDLCLFATLLIVLRLCQMGKRFQAAWVYGLTWLIKPLTLLTAPFILPQLGVWGLLSLAIWGGYLVWSVHWEFGRQQLGFLLHQLMLTSLPSSGRTLSSSMPLGWPATLRKLPGLLLHTLGWRWKRLGRKAVKAFPFYLFPAWVHPWRWSGILLAVVMVFGYGNIKYLLLDLLFLFPVKGEERPLCM